jgi:RNA polymerase sigma-70 factor (ECF subfamily)
MSDGDWGLLMSAAQAGDSAAYRVLLQALGPWLRGYYARRLPSVMIDDAAQDAIMAVHEKRHTYDPARPFKPWLNGIARHKWIDRLEAMKRWPMESLTEDIPVGDHGTAVISATILENLLSTLKPTQAEVIRLVKLQGFSVDEASERTGQSTSLVKVNIHRGLARMSVTAEKGPFAKA